MIKKSALAGDGERMPAISRICRSGRPKMAASEPSPFRWLRIRDARRSAEPAITAIASGGTPPTIAPAMKTASEKRSQTLSKYRPNSEARALVLAREPSAASRQAPMEKTTTPAWRWPDAAISPAIALTSRPVAVTMFGVIPADDRARQTGSRARSFSGFNL